MTVTDKMVEEGARSLAASFGYAWDGLPANSTDKMYVLGASYGGIVNASQSGFMDFARAALLAADAAAEPGPRDATIACLRAEVERLRGALTKISEQHHTTEMEAEDYDGADFESAYATIIELARAALSDGATKYVWEGHDTGITLYYSADDPVDVQQGQWMVLMSDGKIVVSATDPDKEN